MRCSSPAFTQENPEDRFFAGLLSYRAEYFVRNRQIDRLGLSVFFILDGVIHFTVPVPQFLRDAPRRARAGSKRGHEEKRHFLAILTTAERKRAQISKT